MDLVFGIIIFILILLLFLGFFLFGSITKNIKTYDYEMDYLFMNMEKNVGQLNDAMIFIHGSRIDAARLRTFTNAYEDKSIDDFVIGYVGAARGIGLDPAAYDVCLYFTDNDASIISLAPSGIKYLGNVTEGTCNSVINQGKNPCDGYEEAISMFKPVLMDVGNSDINRIVQMNLVVCKK